MQQGIPNQVNLGCRGNEDDYSDKKHLHLFADQSADKHVYAVAKNKQRGEPADAVNKKFFHRPMMNVRKASGKSLINIRQLFVGVEVWPYSVSGIW